MDIDLLSKMVKELILDNDKVVLPGLGYFAAEIVPSTFSDRGYTINPPYRKMYFRQDSGRDGLLARLYAESNGTGTDVAEHIMEDFVRGMREVLDKEKVMIFPGLGRLRATKENNYFFVPDEDMDIFPEGAGLEPVSLKTHTVQTPMPEEAVMESEAGPVAVVEHHAELVLEPDPGRLDAVDGIFPGHGDASVAQAPEPEPEPALENEEPEENQAAIPQEPGLGLEPAAESEIQQPEPEAGQDMVQEAVAPSQDTVQETVRKGIPKWFKIFLMAAAAMVALAAVALGLFVLLADICPDFINSILYSPEELEILNY
ncbi:MAG: hypothetical protein NC308_02915 [Clostridium sp.]|nr:hypothetical protein [Bacteroides sp.]MCM1197816.1 hypothetical protein [Clostridium sp.]